MKTTQNIYFLVAIFGLGLACSKAQFGGDSGSRGPTQELGGDNKGGPGSGGPTGNGTSGSGSNGQEVTNAEDILSRGKPNSGPDGVPGTGDDYVQLPGPDGKLGTVDDTAAFAGPDNKLGTNDDKTVLAGPDGTFGTPDDIPAPPPTGSDWDTASCVKGDKVEFAWTGPIKDCFNQGKTWDFDSSTCVEIRKAPFTCDWPTVTAELTKAELLTPTLRDAPGTGAKLISCGQSQDLKRIVVQWVKEPASGKVDCSNYKSTGAVTTGCYTDYSPQLPPPIPTDPEEKKRQVYGCLNKL